jgi:hypothetical protein
VNLRDIAQTEIQKIFDDFASLSLPQFTAKYLPNTENEPILENNLEESHTNQFWTMEPLPIVYLPAELRVAIFNQIPAISSIAVQFVCKEWREMYKDLFPYMDADWWHGRIHCRAFRSEYHFLLDHLDASKSTPDRWAQFSEKLFPRLAHQATLLNNAAEAPRKIEEFRQFLNVLATSAESVYLSRGSGLILFFSGGVENYGLGIRFG